MEKKEKTLEWVDFIVTARKYRTTLTEKYKNRKVWHKPFAGDVVSSLSGTVVKVNVAAGERVEAGDVLLVLEAMKMYNRVTAPVSGRVAELGVKEGGRVHKGCLMARIDPS